MAAGGSSAASPSPSTSPSNSPSNSPSTAPARGSPFLPTARETLLLAIFPFLLVFGTVFSALSPQTRAAAANTAGSASGTSHYSQSPAAAPSYFARKDNIVNVLFVKKGWFWVTVTFFFFVTTHPFYAAVSTSLRKQHTLLSRRATAILRWGLVTGWWIVVTQWFFGPALIDRSFRMTGGGCEALQLLADEASERGEKAGDTDSATVKLLHAAASSSACRHAGGQWSGGHDISGHVFLLALGTMFLVQEIGWVLWRQLQRATLGSGTSSAGVPSTSRGRFVDSRTIVMGDGAVKSAEVEAGQGDSGIGGLIQPDHEPSLMVTVSRLSIRFAAMIISLCIWMFLMTAIYFHTWTEKLTGLLVALAGYYSVYVVPRFVPGVRRVVGLPGL